MLGAITGDIVGSVYEWDNIKTKDFPLFRNDSEITDDSILTIAVADAFINKKDIAKTLKDYYKIFPNPKGAYGNSFVRWANSETNLPYNSWGNGSAMRVSSIGWLYNTLEDVLENAKKSAEVTHNHPEGIKGAQAVAAIIYLGKSSFPKEKIRNFIENNFNYDLSRNLDDIRKTYQFNESCQQTVPEAITAFLEADGFEDAIRNAISIGGDSDTLACITGAMAESFYRIPDNILDETLKRIPEKFKTILSQFSSIANYLPEIR